MHTYCAQQEYSQCSALSCPVANILCDPTMAYFSSCRGIAAECGEADPRTNAPSAVNTEYCRCPGPVPTVQSLVLWQSDVCLKHDKNALISSQLLLLCCEGCVSWCLCVCIAMWHAALAPDLSSTSLHCALSSGQLVRAAPAGIHKLQISPGIYNLFTNMLEAGKLKRRSYLLALCWGPGRGTSKVQVGSFGIRNCIYILFQFLC